MTQTRTLRTLLHTFIRQEGTWLFFLTLLAFVLRFVWLDRVPPGWRDDEMINSLVISQKVLDGHLAVYYADASGHEALYHALNAIFLGLFGPGVPGIRWLSVILGTMTIPLTYLVGRRMFGRLVGGIAAVGLAFSFWSLMYSRIGLRHILLPVLALAAFYFFWQPLIERKKKGRALPTSLLTALFVALGFYTYFAGRGVPLILLAFMGYVLITAPDVWRQQWRMWGMMLGLALLLAIPLFVTLQQQPEAEGRVAELAVPLVAARQGNFAPLGQHILTTLRMFHSDGDGEWLYNIPHRPVFDWIGALFFWTGVAVAVVTTAVPVFRRAHSLWRKQQPGYQLQRNDSSLSSAFLLFWWLAGISPAFISVPPASLGHTILAQPAVYLLAALPVEWVGKLCAKKLAAWRWRQHSFHTQFIVSGLLGIFLLASIAVRDLPDYFVTWPQRGMVRFLYRADIHEVAAYLQNNQDSPTDFGMTGLLAGPWDKVALQIDLRQETAVTPSPRWYNPQRAILLQPALSFHGWPNVEQAYADWYAPGQVTVGAYRLDPVTKTLDTEQAVCFVNGLCLATAVYHADTHILELGWWVKTSLQLPPISLISNPPPPGVYSGPRLAAFAQLWDKADHFLAGDDGFWVDPYTLQPGDQFIQQHHPQLPEDATPQTAVFGLYDPMTGTRIFTEDGRDYLRLEIGD